jgi:hypothetical protein
MSAFIFVTSQEKEIPLQPVSRFLIDKRLASREKILPPLYSTVVAGGDLEWLYHDEKSLQTDDDRKKWADYLQRKQLEERTFNRDFFKLMLLYGTNLELPADEYWMKKQQSVGITIPTDPVERLLHYIESEYLAVEEDITDLVAKVLEISGSDRAEAEEIRRSFRSALQEQKRRRLQLKGTVVEGERKVSRTKRGPRLGPKTK